MVQSSLSLPPSHFFPLSPSLAPEAWYDLNSDKEEYILRISALEEAKEGLQSGNGSKLQQCAAQRKTLDEAIENMKNAMEE